MNSEVSMWPVISRCILWKSDSDRILIFNVYSERNEASLGPETVKKQDDVFKWKHFPRYWPFVRGIHRWPVNSPHKGQWRGALMFSLICPWINGWVNNRGAGDGAHYDVIVMKQQDGQIGLHDIMGECTHVSNDPFDSNALWYVQNNLHINTLRPRQNSHYFADDIFTCVSLNENMHYWQKMWIIWKAQAKHS